MSVIVDTTTRNITVHVGAGISATWGSLSGKPGVIAAGATAEEARAAIGAGTPTPAVDKIANSVGGAYVVGRTNLTPGAPSRAIPLNEGGTGLTVAIRTSAGHLKSRTFVVEQEAQSGTALSFSSGCTKHENLSTDKTYTFSNGVDGAGMQLQVTNTGVESITMSFTGANIAKGQDGIIGAGEYAIFTICQINGIISVTKTLFDAA